MLASLRITASAIRPAFSAVTLPPHPQHPRSPCSSSVITPAANNNSNVGRQFQALTWRSSPSEGTRIKLINRSLTSLQSRQSTDVTRSDCGRGNWELLLCLAPQLVGQSQVQRRFEVQRSEER